MDYSVIYPLLHIFSLSLSSREALAKADSVLLFYPRGFTLKAYSGFLRQEFVYTGYYQTIVRTVAGIFSSVLLMSPAAYALSKKLKLEGDNRQEQLNLRLAAGEIPDVAKVTLPEIAQYTKQGIPAELPEDMVKKNMPGYYGILQKYDPNLIKYTRVICNFGQTSGTPQSAFFAALSLFDFASG